MHSFLYHAVFNFNPPLCEALEALLVWRLWFGKTAHQFPCLCGFICYDMVRTPALLLVHHFWLAEFSSLYMATEVSTQLWQFLVFCEIVRSVFLPHAGLRRIAWNAFLVVEGLALPAVLGLMLGQMSIAFSGRSVAYVFEQYASLFQALPLLALAALARYYRVPLGRNVRGVVFSLGPNLLINALAFASYQIVHDMKVVHNLELVPAMTFTGMIAAWLWALWQYSPSTRLSASHDAAAFSARQCAQLSQTATGAMRREQN
jgi:hypothetical protein